MTLDFRHSSTKRFGELLIQLACMYIVRLRHLAAVVDRILILHVGFSGRVDIVHLAFVLQSRSELRAIAQKRQDT